MVSGGGAGDGEVARAACSCDARDYNRNRAFCMPKIAPATVANRYRRR